MHDAVLGATPHRSLYFPCPTATGPRGYRYIAITAAAGHTAQGDRVAANVDRAPTAPGWWNVRLVCLRHRLDCGTLGLAVRLPACCCQWLGRLRIFGRAVGWPDNWWLAR